MRLERLSDTEIEFANLLDPTNIFTATKTFTAIINKSSNQCIPSGRIKEIISEIPTAAARKIIDRNEIRKQNPHSPEIATLTKEIYELIDDQRTETWRTTVTELGNQYSSKLFKLLKRMSGQGQASSNQAIKFKGKYVSNPKKIASGFNQQYSAVIKHKSSKESRRISKDIRKRKLVGAPTFTPSQTQ